jgi:hypothetical protein
MRAVATQNFPCIKFVPYHNAYSIAQLILFGFLITNRHFRYYHCIVKGRTQTGVFGNRVLRRIFGSKIDEVTGDWRKLQNEEFHNLFFSTKYY